MSRRPTRTVLVQLFLVLAIVVPGAPQLLLADHAAGLLAAREARANAPVLNRAPARAPLAQVGSPTPSGALPVAVPNAAIDPYAEGHGDVGDPPTNVGFEDDGDEVGTPPANNTIAAASADIGDQPANNAFESGLTDWTVTHNPPASEITAQSETGPGGFARLFTTGSHVPKLTSAAFAVSAAGQVFSWDERLVPGTGSASYSVYALSGGSFGTATILHSNVSASATGWQEVVVDASDFLGQTIKLEARGTGETVDVDRFRVRALVPDHATTGVVRRDAGGGDPFAALTQAAGNAVRLTTAAFTVDNTAQFLSVRAKGLTGGDDRVTIDILSGSGFSTVTNISTGSVADAWTTIRFNVTPFRGQSIKLRSWATQGSVGIDDEAVTRIDFPGWEVTGMAARVAGGHGGSFAALLSANATLTSDDFELSGNLEQLEAWFKAEGSASSVSVKLLRGPTFATEVTFDNGSVTAGADWAAVRAVVVPYRGEDVKLKLTKVGLGQARFDDAGLGERIIPGWTPEGWDNPAQAGDDANGSFVTSSKAPAQIEMRTAGVSLGIADVPSQTDYRFLHLAYDIGGGGTGAISVRWFPTGSGTGTSLFSATSSPATGYVERWVRAVDTLAGEGTFLVTVTRGKLYTFGDNDGVWADDCVRKAAGTDTSTGSFGRQETDFAGAGGPMGLSFERTYLVRRDQAGSLGQRWAHTYETKLVFNSTTDIGVVWPDGDEEWFSNPSAGNNGVSRDGRNRSVLTENGDGSYVVRTKGNVLYRFTSTGVLTKLEDLNGNTLEIERDGGGKISKVRQRLDGGTYTGRELVFAYSGDRISTITGPGSAVVAYAYDGGDLVTVTDAEDNDWAYAYEMHRLVSLTDPDHLASDPPVHVFANTYDFTGRVTAQEDGSGEAVTFAYETEDGTPSVEGVTQFTDRNGEEQHVFYNGMAATTGEWDATERGTAYAFDARHNVTTRTDPAGETWTATFDAASNETSRKNPLQVADPSQGQVTTTWVSGLNRPDTITDARGFVTDFTYDGSGNLTRREVRDGSTVLTATEWTYDAKGNVLTEVVDPGTSPHLNITTSYTYDATTNDRLTMTDPAGKVWEWEYDAAGRATAAIDPLDHRTETTYDALGMVESVEDAAGGVTEYAYNGAGLLVAQTVKVTASLDRVTGWAYDDRGLVETVTDPAGVVTSYLYDAEERVIETTVDPGSAPHLHLETAHAYDDAGRLVGTTVDPGSAPHLNLVTTTEYDAAGRVAETTDPLGRVTAYQYDDAGRPTATIVDPGTSPHLNQTTTYGYDKDGNRTTVTNALSKTTTTAYDGLNRVVSVTDPLGVVTTHAYDPAGRRTSTTVDPGSSPHLNLVTTTTYTATGRVASVTAPGSRITSFAYDDAGRRTGTTVDPGTSPHLDLTTTTGYDEVGRVVSVTDPLSRTDTTEYNFAGQVTRRESAGGVVTEYAYDAVGRPTTTVVDPGTSPHLNLTTVNAYDAAGRRVSVTDPRSNETEFAFDAAGRMVLIEDALGGEVELAYDAAGQLTAVTNAREKTTSYEYDVLGNVVETTDPLNRSRTNEYDILGRLESATDARAVTVEYAYDDADRLTEIDPPGTGDEVAFDYDAASRRTEMVDPTGTTEWVYDSASRVTSVVSPQGTVGYGYDTADRRTSLTLPGSRTVDYEHTDGDELASLTDWASRETTFAYNDDGQRTAIVRPNGIATDLTYDDAGRLVEVEHLDGMTTVQRFAYELDANGNRTKATLLGGGEEEYALDALNRLTEVVYANGDEVAYEYDAGGNRVEMTVTPNGGSPTVTTYDYDAADQLTDDGSLLYDYDENGNLVEAGSDTFEWDWANRMAEATVGSTTAAYGYAGDGMRVSKTVASATTPYLWDRVAGLPLLLDDDTESFLHAAGPLAAIDGDDDATFSLLDGIGSVRGRTSDAGTLIGSRDYDVFGTVRASSGTGDLFGFAGEQTDAETGQIYLRARMYAPGVGRFTGRDPRFPGGDGTQGYNPYAYAGNNPSTWRDPSGTIIQTSNDCSLAEFAKLPCPESIYASGAQAAWKRTTCATIWPNATESYDSQIGVEFFWIVGWRDRTTYCTRTLFDNSNPRMPVRSELVEQQHFISLWHNYVDGWDENTVTVQSRISYDDETAQDVRFRRTADDGRLYTALILINVPVTVTVCIDLSGGDDPCDIFKDSFNVDLNVAVWANLDKSAYEQGEFLPIVDMSQSSTDCSTCRDVRFDPDVLPVG